MSITDYCECDDTHKKNETVCRYCWGKTVDKEYVLPRWWKRLGKYLDVRVLAKPTKKLIKGQVFNTKYSFKISIVVLCLVDYLNVYRTIDERKISQRIAPVNLMEELYNICLECNPSLTVENFRDQIVGRNNVKV